MQEINENYIRARKILLAAKELVQIYEEIAPASEGIKSLVGVEKIGLQELIRLKLVFALKLEQELKELITQKNENN